MTWENVAQIAVLMILAALCIDFVLTDVKKEDK